MSNHQRLSRSVKDRLIADMDRVEKKSVLLITKKKKERKITKLRNMIEDMEALGRVPNY